MVEKFESEKEGFADFFDEVKNRINIIEEISAI